MFWGNNVSFYFSEGFQNILPLFFFLSILAEGGGGLAGIGGIDRFVHITNSDEKTNQKSSRASMSKKTLLFVGLNALLFFP